VVLKLIVEVDGKHHQTEDGRERDESRDQYLAKRGYAVLRIPGYEVLRDPAGVRYLIENAINARIEFDSLRSTCCLRSVNSTDRNSSHSQLHQG
jgi:very-short-patch-repair endonuclease